MFVGRQTQTGAPALPLPNGCPGESPFVSVVVSFVLERMGMLLGPTPYGVVGIEVMHVKCLEHST